MEEAIAFARDAGPFDAVAWVDVSDVVGGTVPVLDLVHHALGRGSE